MTVFVRKITADLTWRRPVAQDSPLMRVQGICTRGEEHASTLGRFVVWRGQFAAIVVRKPGDDGPKSGYLEHVASYTLILPSVGSDWLRSYFEEDRKTLSPNGSSTATGLEFVPAQGLDNIRFVLDIGIGPSKQKSPEDKGYQYVIRIAAADPRLDPMGDVMSIAAGLSAFNPTMLAPSADDDAPMTPLGGGAAPERP